MKDPGTGFIGRLSKREIMLIALLIACIGAYACFSLLLSPLMEENGDLAKYVDSLTLRESSLSAEYAKAGEYGARIEEAVRDNAEIRGQIPAYLASHEFVRDVEAAAEDNNVTVTGISVSEIGVSGYSDFLARTIERTGYGRKSFYESVRFSGVFENVAYQDAYVYLNADYDDFVAFLTDVELRGRFYIVDQVTLSRTDEGGVSGFIKVKTIAIYSGSEPIVVPEIGEPSYREDVNPFEGYDVYLR